MNARKDRLSMLFSTPAPAPALTADNEAPVPARVSSGSVRSMKDSFSGIERENETLREALSSGNAVLDIDPARIEPSPVTDRFAESDSAAFESLKNSIERHGQEVPILVRKHPLQEGRYQAAYGHRRLKAALELGRPVRAVVRPLSDQELVVAQGLENAARLDLTFIERAVFALRLEEAGHERQVVQDALTIDRAEASKLVAVARQIPRDLIEAIGRAPKIGRPRWLQLSEFVQHDPTQKRMRKEIADKAFKDADTDARFLRLLNIAVAIKSGPADEKEQGVVASISGAAIARMKKTKTEIQISFDRTDKDLFGAFVLAELPALFERFCEAGREEPGA
jgi:ParB family chromosome partitioning protein